MGKNPEQLALNCIVKIRDYSLTENAYSSAAQMVLNPTEETVNRVIDRIMRTEGDPKVRPRFSNEYSHRLLVCSIALDMIRPEIGDRVAFLTANRMFGSERPDDEEVGDWIIHKIMSRFDVSKAYEKLIEAAKKYSYLVTGSNTFEEQKSIKRYEMRVARIKHNSPKN